MVRQCILWIIDASSTKISSGGVSQIGVQGTGGTRTDSMPGTWWQLQNLLCQLHSLLTVPFSAPECPSRHPLRFPSDTVHAGTMAEGSTCSAAPQTAQTCSAVPPDPATSHSINKAESISSQPLPQAPTLAQKFISDTFARKRKKVPLLPPNAGNVAKIP